MSNFLDGIIQHTHDITPRIRERTISVCHESCRRLHCSLCGPGYVGHVLWTPSTETDFHSFFQWEDILQVIIPRTSALALVHSGRGGARVQDEGLTTCPICLSFPVASRMTKCGHVSTTDSISEFLADGIDRYSASLVSCTI